VARIDVKKQFGTSVRAWRTRLGISQEELGERAGLHRTYISDVERGARNVSLESIEKLARALQVTVSKLLTEENEGSTCKSSGEPPLADALMDILLVEDEAYDVELTLAALKSANIANDVYVVRDGAAALDYLFRTGAYAQRPRSDRPPMVLLDLNLPKLSGLEVLERIKADPRTCTIPIIILTASRYDRDIAVSNQLGAAGYIVKPLGFQNLSEVTLQLRLQWALLDPRRARTTE
jgi:CheY-like chemotaxis protein/DNA-binding XRE family transcriptional regulator